MMDLVLHRAKEWSCRLLVIVIVSISFETLFKVVDPLLDYVRFG